MRGAKAPFLFASLLALASVGACLAADRFFSNTDVVNEQFYGKEPPSPSVGVLLQHVRNRSHDIKDPQSSDSYGKGQF